MQNNTRHVKQQDLLNVISSVSGLINKTKSESPSLSLCLSCLQTVINTMCGFGVQTQKYMEANKSIYPVGCADKAVLWIESHLLLVGALALGLALPQVLQPCNFIQAVH